MDEISIFIMSNPTHDELLRYIQNIKIEEYNKGYIKGSDDIKREVSAILDKIDSKLIIH